MTSLDYLFSPTQLVMVTAPPPKRAPSKSRTAKIPTVAASTMPGQRWLEVVGRAKSETFAQAFVKRPVLEALVLRTPRIGIDAIRDYFETSHRLFDRIAFIREARTPDRQFLEWEGRFGRKPVCGVTILSLAEDGRIARIRIHHYPQEQATAFAAALEQQDQAS